MAQRGNRRDLAEEQASTTHRFSIGGEKGYVTASFFPDGRAAELMITMGVNGEPGRALLDAIGVLTSVALQHGAPLEEIAEKMEHTVFEPSGLTRNKAIPHATSVLDYVYKWLCLKQEESQGRGGRPRARPG